MENKICNKYGAVIGHTTESAALIGLGNRVSQAIDAYFEQFPDLDPVEIRCVQAYLSQDCSCATEVLRKAMNLRKNESN